MHRFLIFAHARSGSTSLTRSLNLHPDISVAEEPFHHNYGEWHPDERTYVDSIQDTESLEVALEEIYGRYDGMKVLDYQLSEETYSHLLLSPDYRVIYLRRRNLLKTAVSGMIAHQTGVWHISDLNAERARKYQDLEPLDLEDLQKRLEYGIELRDFYGEVISKKRQDDVLRLEYEDLYTTNVADTRKAFSEVFGFLGLGLPDSDQLDGYLDADSARINTTERHASIPNAEEIDQRFGNDETGWLLADN